MTDPARPKSADAEAMAHKIESAVCLSIIGDGMVNASDAEKQLIVDALRAATQPSPHSEEWNAAKVADVVERRLSTRRWTDNHQDAWDQYAKDLGKDIASALTRPIQQSGGEER